MTYYNQADASFSFDLKTKEGFILSNGANRSENGANGSLDITENIYVDLFEKEFSTEDDKLYLHLYTFAHGRFISYYENSHMWARSSFSNIKARYK